MSSLRAAAISAFLLFPVVSLAQDAVRALEVVAKKQVFEPLMSTAPSGNAGVFVGVNLFDKDESLNSLAYAVNDAVETAYAFAIELKLIPPANCTILISGEPNDEGSNRVVADHLEQLKRSGAKVRAADRSEILYSFLE